MSLKEVVKKYEWIIPIVLIVAAFFGGDYYGHRKVEKSLVSETDTITKIVTVYKDFPQPIETAQIGFIPVPMYKFITDTVNTVETAYLHDTTVVYLPREEKYYEEEEGRLRMWVSGYDPRLDRYEFDAIIKTITNTIYVTPSRWSFSVSAGLGVTYGLVNKTIDAGPTIVLGGSYRF